MRGWRFVIDEAGFAFEVDDPAVVESSLAQFLDLLAYVRRTPSQVRRSDLLFEIESVDGRTLADHLNDRSIDRDIRNEMWSRLDKIPAYEESPSSLDFEIDGSCITMAPSIGVCLSSARNGRELACLTTDQARRSGLCEVTSIDCLTSGEVHFLVEESHGREFWRRLLRQSPALVTEFTEYGWLFYPNLVFAEDVWSQLNRFKGPQLLVWSILLDNLAGLDDYALPIWTEQVESSQRQKQMRIRAGVNCSPESPNTHANPTAMRKRTVEFDNVQIVCEWHAKLEPQRNRVHFAVSGGRVYIGLFVDHLPT